MPPRLDVLSVPRAAGCWLILLDKIARRSIETRDRDDGGGRLFKFRLIPTSGHRLSSIYPERSDPKGNRWGWCATAGACTPYAGRRDSTQSIGERRVCSARRCCCFSRVATSLTLASLAWRSRWWRWSIPPSGEMARHGTQRAERGQAWWARDARPGRAG